MGDPTPQPQGEPVVGLYHVIVTNRATGAKTYATATPVTAREGVTIMGKIPAHRLTFKNLEPATKNKP